MLHGELFQASGHDRIDRPSGPPRWHSRVCHEWEPDAIFDSRDFEASADGFSEPTEARQAAIDWVGQKGYRVLWQQVIEVPQAPDWPHWGATLRGIVMNKVADIWTNDPPTEPCTLWMRSHDIIYKVTVSKRPEGNRYGFGELQLDIPGHGGGWRLQAYIDEGAQWSRIDPNPVDTRKEMLAMMGGMSKADRVKAFRDLARYCPECGSADGPRCRCQRGE